MRFLFTFIIILVAGALNAQTISPGVIGGVYTNSLYYNHHLYDTAAPKKWFVSRYIGIDAGYSFSKAGNTSFVSAPLSLFAPEFLEQRGQEACPRPLYFGASRQRLRERAERLRRAMA